MSTVSINSKLSSKQTTLEVTNDRLQLACDTYLESGVMLPATLGRLLRDLGHAQRTPEYISACKSKFEVFCFKPFVSSWIFQNIWSWERTMMMLHDITSATSTCIRVPLLKHTLFPLSKIKLQCGLHICAK